VKNRMTGKFLPVQIYGATGNSLAYGLKEDDGAQLAGFAPGQPRSATDCPPSATMVAPVTKRPASETSRSSGPSRSRSFAEAADGICRVSALPFSLVR